ncbi:hypothetical protein C4J81_16805 [Deltaproteobacteria bacterium Smac51]|nr:hypothetical protein C4J81_16805 [Deltaproteobacteria bacterium Smac51]
MHYYQLLSFFSAVFLVFLAKNSGQVFHPNNNKKLTQAADAPALESLWREPPLYLTPSFHRQKNQKTA